MRVQNKIAFVTGGAGGIGAECARRLAAEGAKVIITDMDEAAGTAVAREVGGDFHRLDVTDLDAWQRVAAAAIDKHRDIDIFLQCAGIEGDLRQDCLDTHPDVWNKVLAVNLTGTFWGCKTIVPTMLRKGTGSVILLSSISSYMATPALTPYGVSKAGVQHLSRSVAMVGARNGARVRCNSVHPGVIKTRMTDNIILELSQARQITEVEAEVALMSAVPFRARGTPEDVAGLVLYLASDESAYVTGSDFKIDGGWHVVNAA